MAKKGAMRRDPKFSTQPVKTGNEQKMGRTPREKPMERLSPGVYRGSSGGLVGQGGRPIQRPPQAPQRPQMPTPMQYQPGQVGQAVADQANKPFDMSQYNPEQIQAQDMARQLEIRAGGQPGQIESGMYWNPNFNPGSIGKTPPGWSGGQINNMMVRTPSSYFGSQVNDMMWRGQMPQGMPQMPQASANMGGQYRLSPGMYGSREQAMQQYNQEMQQMYQGVPQQRKV